MEEFTLVEIKFKVLNFTDVCRLCDFYDHDNSICIKSRILFWVTKKKSLTDHSCSYHNDKAYIFKKSLKYKLSKL